jgi:hypothetical protein
LVDSVEIIQMFVVHICDSLRKVRQNYLLPLFGYFSPGSAVIKLLQNNINNYRFSCPFTGWKLGFSLERNEKERNYFKTARYL